MTIDEQMAIICKGAADVISPEDLRAKLESSGRTGKPLVVKLGLDPSAPDIHLGHTVVLRKIKQLQDLGHRAVLIIGDFTGRIGDPTGKSKTRRQLTEQEVRANAETYERQLLKILDPGRTEFLFNSAWLGKLNFADVLGLAAKATVARILERDDFQNRMQSGQPVGMHELYYPLMQAYDSVELKADIELGGTDQRFNILFGRDLLAGFGMERQVAILMPLLEGLEGKQKMSKSLGNYVGVHDQPMDMYGKIMSIPDGMIVRWFELLTDVLPNEIVRVRTALEHGDANPMDLKMRLAREITALYCGEDSARAAEQGFISVHQRRELPGDMPEFTLPLELKGAEGTDMAAVLVRSGMAATTSEARRLIAQGAVRVNGVKSDSLKAKLSSGDILQAGKFKAARIL